MGSALTNVSLPILLNRKQQSNHPNFELPNINVFLEDRREQSLLFVHLMLDSHCLRQAPNLTSYSHPKLLSWLLFLHCLRDERWAAQRKSAKTDSLSQMLKLTYGGILKKILIPNTTMGIQKVRNISESAITSSMGTKKSLVPYTTN